MSEPMAPSFSSMKRHTDLVPAGEGRSRPDRITESMMALERQAGGEFVLLCDSSWANEATAGFGIVKSPASKRCSKMRSRTRSGCATSKPRHS